MDGLNGSGPYGGVSTSHGGPALAHKISQRYRYYLDKTTPHYTARWLALLAFLVLYGIRVYLLKGTFTVHAASNVSKQLLPALHRSTALFRSFGFDMPVSRS